MVFYFEKASDFGNGKKPIKLYINTLKDLISLYEEDRKLSGCSPLIIDFSDDGKTGTITLYDHYIE
jgi:hypothetical protein